MAKKKSSKGKGSKNKQGGAKQNAATQEAPREPRNEAVPASSSGSGLSTAWLGGMLGALAVGVGFAIYLTQVHVSANYGEGVTKSVCDFGANFSCTDVATSPWAALFNDSLHIPITLLAIPAYLLMAWLAFGAWKKGSTAVELGLLFGLGLMSVAYGLVLLGVQIFDIGKFCLFCLGMDLVSVTVLVMSFLAAKSSFGDLFRRGLSGLRPNNITAVGALIVVVSFGLSWGVYASAKSSSVDKLAAQALGTDVNAGADAAANGAASTGNNAAKPPAPATTTAPPGDPTAGQTRKVRVAEMRHEFVIRDDAPTLGPKNAKVTVIEFSDFQCPFCKRLSGTLHKLHEEYPKDVRVVFMNFPMQQKCNSVELAKSMHPQACLAARAGYCAADQGKFWELHDLMFKRQSKLSGKEIGRLARGAGIDVKKLAACVDEERSLKAVQHDTAEAGKAGVTGTPAMFVNGRRLVGAQPIEVLRKVVDAELAGSNELLDLEVQVGAERLGEVEAPSMVDITYGRYPFSIDTFEAAVENGRAVSGPGLVATGSLSWHQAEAACKAAGKRMCTEEEWLVACTGKAERDNNNNGVFSDDLIEGNEYAYGAFWEPGYCPDSRTKANPGILTTGNHPLCKSASGVYDMHGNVKEWVGLTAADASVKGGSFFSGESARCGYNRDDIAPGTDDDISLGVRCCKGRLPDEVVESAEEYPGGKVGDKLLAFKQPFLEGGSFDSKTLAGKPAIVGFWASWCGPCKKEMPILNDLYKTYKGQGLQVIGISVDEDPEAAKKWLADNPMDFPILQDPDSKLVDRFDTRGVPTTFWVLPDGTIRQRTVGVPGGGHTALEQFAKDLLGG